MLEDNYLELGEVKNEFNEEYDKGGVFYQDPLPDVEVESGSKVGITLSKGPQPESELEKNPPDPPTQDLYLTVPKMGLYDTTADDVTPVLDLFFSAPKFGTKGIRLLVE